MKELTIEEKAKAYDEAIERAKSKIKNDKDHVLYEDDVIEIFPELKESEDERTIKELIIYLKSILSNKKYGDKFIEGWIAWLEVQGEQKPQRMVSAEAKEAMYDKPAWSEEDEVGLANAMWAIEQARTIAKDENDMGNLWYAERWLKSFIPKTTWKPSEEQLKSLQEVVDVGHFTSYPNSLETLYEQLKKLKG